jgi:uncharacterized membrane protein YsdA (DUF1294 family)
MNELYFILYVIINIVVFVLYGIDKYKAIHELYRISENTLLIAAFFGPFGAYAGMRLFRHKIRKLKFSILVPIFILVHIGLYILYISGII